MSMELASRSESKFLCPGCKNKSAIIQLSDFESPSNERSFLQSLFLTTPFKSLLTARLRRHSADYADVWSMRQGYWTAEGQSKLSKESDCIGRRGAGMQLDLSGGMDLRPATAFSTSVDWPTVEGLSVSHLTLPIIEAVIAKYVETEDPSFLISLLRNVFVSSDALNMSFVESYENAQNFLSLSSTGGNDEVLVGDLDLGAVRQAYHLLVKLEPTEIFHTTIIDATAILLTTLESANIEPTEINQLLIILENPLLEEPSCHELLKKLCRILASLNDNSIRELTAYLLDYDSVSFSRLLKMFQDHFSSLLYPCQRAEPHLFPHLKVLALLYDVMKQSESVECGAGKALYTDFYCEAIAKRLDFKADYNRWKKRMSSIAASSSVLPTVDDYSLLDFPFLFDPACKVRVLHIDAVMQMRQEYQDALVHQAAVQQAQLLLEDREKSIVDVFYSASCPFFVLEVRRDHLVEDALVKLAGKQHHFKKPLKISYIGGGEQGLDMGGLQKEFFHLIVDAVFDPAFGMFVYSDETHCFWFNSASLETEKEFELVGILLGLAIYNGVILDIRFPRAVYKKLQGETLSLSDLIDCQPSLGHSLLQLLEYEGDVENAFCYSFQVSYMMYGQVKDVDLIPNGSLIAVTSHNRHEFVDLYVHHLLEESIAPQFESFARGLKSVCGSDVLSLCRSDELEMLICGSPELDFSSLEKSARYEDGYKRKSPVIQWLWDAVQTMTHEQKQQLLLFVTGSNRVPLKGISSLAFTIQRNGPDSDRLPTAMTCFNRLLLPEYSDKNKLTDRLTKALENSRGFGLT
ncbi:probable E3 ubiquitin-protein ligase HECTD2 isoform X2 [Corticium candelabrum]|nr:probable E3 ubiquitin-protein ligase HECTD2 isoform X2 [Corticium candelabrum]